VRRAWLAAAVLALTAATHDPETFANDELGFEVALPRDAATCRADPARRDSVAMFLDGGLDGCNLLDERPYVEIRARANDEKFGTARDVLAERCGAAAKKPLEDVELGGRKAAACRSDAAETAWVDVFAVTLADGHDFAKLAYEAHLHTTQEHFGEDFERFQNFAAHDVRLALPEFVDTLDARCKDANDDKQRADCSAARAKRAEAELARSEAKLEALSTPDQARALDKARDAWLDYRKLHCEAFGSFHEGDLQAAAVSDCFAELARERTRELQAVLDDAKPAAAEAP